MITKFTKFTEKNIPFKMELPDDIYQIKKEFDKYGKKLYVVGGAVRDLYLGKIPHDIDLVTDSEPEESKKILKDFNVSDEQGKNFGVLRIYTESEPLGYELAVFRKDISKGRDTKGDTPKVEIGKHITIEDDVRRRDLTQNALFYDIDKGEIVDLVGGIDDIDNNVISAVGNASERFNEDRLRILRTIRFAARNRSKISQSTIDAIQNDKRLRNISTIDDVSQERIVEEFEKSIEWSKKNNNINSLHYYLYLLDEYDLFDEMFPGLNINIDDINTFNLVIIYALLFRNNDISKLKVKMPEYKIPSKYWKPACFLLILIKEIDNLDRLEYLYKEKKRYDIDNNTIKEFAKLLNIKSRYLKAFLKYETTVNAEELMDIGFKGAELGAEIKKREIENFKKLL
jgi:tRNA nucleotidyltransferase/poly(A) polymerase